MENYVSGLNSNGNGVLLISATSGFTSCRSAAAAEAEIVTVVLAGALGIITVSSESPRRNKKKESDDQ